MKILIICVYACLNGFINSEFNENYHFMSMKKCLFLMIGVTLLCINRSQDGQFFRCTKLSNRTEVEVEFLCVAKHNGPLLIPSTVTYDTEKLYIHANTSKGTLAIAIKEVFNNYTKLKTLHLYTSVQFTIFKVFRTPPESFKALKKRLFDLPMLQEFLWSHKGQSEEYDRNWILPKSVVSVTLIDSATCDLTGCPYLEVLNCTNCQLKKMPPLYDPDPPLNALNLVNNPLSELTVNDVARFCLLKELVLDKNEFSYCECKRMEEWVKELKKSDDFTFGGSLTCQNDGGDCSKYTLDEATRIRRGCLLGYYWKTYQLLFLLLASIAIPLSLLCVVLCFRRFRRRRAEKEYDDYDDEDYYDDYDFDSHNYYDDYK